MVKVIFEATNLKICYIIDSYLYVYVYIYICIYVYLPIYMCTYIYIRIYIYTVLYVICMHNHAYLYSHPGVDGMWIFQTLSYELSDLGEGLLSASHSIY
jgi:hypothetical protein